MNFSSGMCSVSFRVRMFSCNTLARREPEVSSVAVGTATFHSSRLLTFKMVSSSCSSPSQSWRMRRSGEAETDVGTTQSSGMQGTSCSTSKCQVPSAWHVCLASPLRRCPWRHDAGTSSPSSHGPDSGSIGTVRPTVGGGERHRGRTHLRDDKHRILSLFCPTPPSSLGRAYLISFLYERQVSCGISLCQDDEVTRAPSTLMKKRRLIPACATIGRGLALIHARQKLPCLVPLPLQVLGLLLLTLSTVCPSKYDGTFSVISIVVS